MRGQFSLTIGLVKAVHHSGKQPVPAGKATIRFEFTTDGGKLGAGGTGSIFVNGTKVATGRIENTNGLLFSADEGADVGVDEGTPVTEDYAGPDSRFNGEIIQVTIDLKPIGPDIKDKVDKAPTTHDGQGRRGLAPAPCAFWVFGRSGADQAGRNDPVRQGTTWSTAE